MTKKRKTNDVGFWFVLFSFHFKQFGLIFSGNLERDLVFRYFGFPNIAFDPSTFVQLAGIIGETEKQTKQKK